jgi:hypothetical protein
MRPGSRPRVYTPPHRVRTPPSAVPPTPPGPPARRALPPIPPTAAPFSRANLAPQGYVNYVPHAVLRSPFLSPAARLAYVLVLASRPDPDGHRLVRDGQLLRWLDCSPRELRTLIEGLVTAGLIQVSRRGHHAGAWQFTTSLAPRPGRGLPLPPPHPTR